MSSWRGGGPATGIAWAFGGTFLATVLLLLARMFGEPLDPVQITFIRYLSAVLILLPAMIWRARLARGGYGVHFFGRHAGLNGLRAVFAVVRISLIFYAIARMPFANAQAISLTNAVFVVIFAVMLLGERLTWPVALFGLICLSGAGLVSVVHFDAATLAMLPALAVLLAAAIWGLEAVIIRYTASRDRFDRILFAVNSLALVLVMPFAIPNWNWPQTGNWLWLFLLGPVALCVQGCNMLSLKLAPASAVAPARYGSIVFALLAGWLVFGEWPAPAAFAGMALIVAGGIGLTFVMRNQPHH